MTDRGHAAICRVPAYLLHICTGGADEYFLFDGRRHHY